MTYLRKFNDVTYKPNFEMFTKQGNAKCKGIVKKALRKIYGKNHLKHEPFEAYVKSLIDDVSKIESKDGGDVYGEIWDSEPPYHIQHYINRALKEQEYSFTIEL